MSARRTRRAPPSLRQFLGAYDPAVARLFLAARRAVLAAAPEANELVYDAYNAVAVAYSFSDRLKEAFCHLAAYRGHVNLGFNQGARLADSERLLAGSGARIRHVRLAAAADLARPGVTRLLRAAVEQGRALAPDASGAARAIVRPVTGPKRRPRGRA